MSVALKAAAWAGRFKETKNDSPVHRTPVEGIQSGSGALIFSLGWQGSGVRSVLRAVPGPHDCDGSAHLLLRCYQS